MPRWVAKVDMRHGTKPPVPKSSYFCQQLLLHMSPGLLGFQSTKVIQQRVNRIQWVTTGRNRNDAGSVRIQHSQDFPTAAGAGLTTADLSRVEAEEELQFSWKPQRG